MPSYIFVRRPGGSTRRIPVITARPRAHAAASAMCRAGHRLHFIAWSLRIKRERVDVIAGPAAFFKITTKRAA